MPRAGWTKADVDHRLSDHLAFAVLMRVFPPGLVDNVIADVGRVQQRNRLLPSRVVVYYVLGLALFSHSSYDEVIRLLIASQSWSSGWSQSLPVPTKAALYKARQRLGFEPLQALFETVAVATGSPAGGRGFHGPWRVLDIDCVSLDVPATDANRAGFDPQHSVSVAGPVFPAVRVLGVTERASGAVLGASVGRGDQDFSDLGATLLPKFMAGWLVMAGDDLYSAELWAKAAATDADLLWQLPPGAKPPPGRASRIVDVDKGTAASARFVTTIVDPELASDDDLIELFAARRTLASAFDEFRVHHSSPRVVLRSKAPDGVRQELYGYLCVHYAMRLIVNPPMESTAPVDSFS
jgi:hypothetical protein